MAKAGGVDAVSDRASALLVAIGVDSMTPKLDLVSAGTAARILGVPHTAITKLKRKGRLVGVPVEGTVDVYLRGDVEMLAEVLAGERAERASASRNRAVS